MTTTITTTEGLAAFCRDAARQPYITVDTEFLRERTFWSKLCLVQLAMPGEGDAGAALVDPLAGEFSLEPLYELFRDERVVKVFHAARQDLEIFWVEGRVFPKPLFDTQVAAMVCGFGEQAGYETLVRHIAKAHLDKASRFTDWSRRPLSDAQKAYAIADVTHLRKIYEHLDAELERTGRREWVEEELAVLTDPATYASDPEDAWQRIKTRSGSEKFFAAVKELARFREIFAQARDVPRNRILKDDALIELASTRPHSIEELSRARLLLRDARKGEIAEGILAAIRTAQDYAPGTMARPGRERDRVQPDAALSDLLRVLLKAKAEEAGVAQRLIANSSELDALAAGARDLPSLNGWRRKVFGADALRLCEGRIALAAQGGSVRLVEVG